MKKERKRWLFYPLLLSIILIVTPSCLSLLFLMKYSLSHTVAAAEQTNERMLYQIRDQIESVYGELEMITASLAMNPSVNSLFRELERSDTPDFYKIYETQNKLPRYDLSNKYVQNVDILFKRGDVLLSPSGSTVDLYDTLKRQYAPGSEGQGTENALWNRIYHSSIVNTGRDLFFLSSFPFETRTPKALIIIKIDREELYKLLSFFDIGDRGQIEITGNLSAPIVYPEGSRDFGNSRLLVNRAPSRQGNWEVVSRIPYSYVIGSVRSTRNTLIVGTVLSISLTMFLGFMLLKWNSRPIIGLIAKLDPWGGKTRPSRGRDEGYGMINSRVDTMLAESRSLKKQLALQKSFLQRSYLLNLIRGDYGDKNESQELAAIAGLSPEFFPVALIIIQSGSPPMRGVNYYTQRDKTGRETYQFLTETLKAPSFFYPLEEGGLLFLISSSPLKNPREALEKDLLGHLESLGGDPVSLFYGGIGEDAEEIHSAYARAELLARTTVTTSFGFYGREDIRDRVEAFTYPVEWEIKLLTYVKAGNRGKAAELLDRMGEANFKSGDSCLLTQSRFVSLLYGTLARCTRTIQDVPGENQDPYESYEAIRERLLEIAASHARQKEREDDQLRDRILAYMEEHYSDPGFTLYQMATSTGFSESVLYNRFKTLFGQTFASYLEALRIDKGTELLEKGEKIVDIAARTGFSNTQTFRRVFKRKTGIPPSSFVNALF